MRNCFDAIIIGAGSVGVPLSFSLSKAGLSTLVIDREASVGQGSNKRAIGGIRATHSDPAKVLICQRSIEIFSGWKQINGDDIEWYQGGYCFVAYGKDEAALIKNVVKEQSGYGLKINWLETADLLSRIPSLESDGLIGGSFSPNDGSASPLLTIQAFYRKACLEGALFNFNETVTDILHHNDKIEGIKTDKSTYYAPLVINAAGAWAVHIADLVGIHLPVRPDAHEAAVTEPVAHFLDPMIVDIQPSPGASNFYFYQHATGQVFFCLTPEPNQWGFSTEETSQFLPMACKRLLRVMPSLANIRVRRTWRGLYPMTPDGSPMIGWAGDLEGFFLAAGMCGQGFMLGPGMAELITRMVMGEKKKEDEFIIQKFSPEREFQGAEKLK